jgi:hypothetical protein
MPHSKTPGQSNAASDKFNKQEAESTSSILPAQRFSWDVILTNITGKGLGASNAPAAKQGNAPGEAPVASDSGNSNVGVDPSANKPGEKGIGGPNYGTH